MFREIRRVKQTLSMEECQAVLERQTAGVLSVQGDDGYPYGVPLSYVYHEGRLYFHSANEGHKVDAIRRDNKVSFTVIDQDTVVPEEYTTYFKSVIVFGQAFIMEDMEEKKAALEILAKRYSPMQVEGRKAEIEKLFAQVTMIRLEVDHMSGKQATELM